MSEAANKGQRRPTAEDVEPILEMIWAGKSLRKACEALGLHVPSTSDLMNSAGCREQYARAREGRAEHLAEDALTITRAAALGLTVSTGDAGQKTKVDASGARAYLDAAKWRIGQMVPKLAPMQRVEHSFDGLSDDELEDEINRLQGADESPAEP